MRKALIETSTPRIGCLCEDAQRRAMHGAGEGRLFFVQYGEADGMERVRRAAQRPEEQAEEAVRAILAIERKTREILAEARDEARRIVSTARQRAAELQEAAAKETEARVSGILERGAVEAQREADQIRARGETAAAAWRQHAESRLTEAIDFVVDVVAFPDEEA